jgi:hypothetical protein
MRCPRVALRAVTLAAAALMTVQLSAAAVVATPPRSPEYLIKAAYLYNFAMFVEWPEEAFTAANAPIVVGVVGDDPFGWALDRTVLDKRINNRRIEVKRLKIDDEDVRRCHILFVSRAESSRVADLAQRIGRLSVLIVGDDADTLTSGGTIAFSVKDNKVGFAINLAAARRARLAISSKLLNLARVVLAS